MKSDRRWPLVGACLLAVAVCLPSLSSPHGVGNASADVDPDNPLHAQMATARLLGERMRSASGLASVTCEAREPRPDGPQVLQWCCLVPKLTDVRKVKAGRASKPKRRSRRRTLTDGPGDEFVYESERRGGGVASTHVDSSTGQTTVVETDGTTWLASAPASWDWRCLPSFIIAGTQKSGSTALAAYLLAHPQAALGREKEMHYFDKEQPLGLVPYAFRFGSAVGQDLVGTVTARRVDLVAGYKPARNGTEPAAMAQLARAKHPDNPLAVPKDASPASSGPPGRNGHAPGVVPVVFVNVDVPGVGLFHQRRFWSEFPPGSEVKVQAAPGDVWHAARVPPGAAPASTSTAVPRGSVWRRLWRSWRYRHGRRRLSLNSVQLLRRWEVASLPRQMFTLRRAPPFVNGEATPFYIAERNSCRNMATELPEVPALIVLVRNPVERAYSEYQMKIRRVETQDDFLGAVQDSAWALLQCATRNPLNSSSWDHCMPKRITDDAKWKTLRSALRDVIRGAVAQANADAPPAKDPKPHGVGTAEHGLTSSLPIDHIARCFYTTAPTATATTTATGRYSPSPTASSSAAATTTGDLPQGHFASLHDRTTLTAERLHDPSFLALVDTTEGRRSVAFDVTKCVPKGLNERVTPLDVFEQETTAFLECAGPAVFDGPAELDAAVGRCIKVKHGIGGQYVYRGLYAAQLVHCFKSIPRDKVLVLDSDLLKRDPTAAMRRVHAHLRLSPYNYSTTIRSPDDLHDVFERWYPSFEARSGWRIEGEYAPMSDALRTNLTRFYAPFNRMLFDLVGERFDWAGS